LKVLFLYPELQSFSHKALGPSILISVLKKEGHEVALFDSSLYKQTKILPDSSLREKDLTPLYWFKKAHCTIPKPDSLHIDVVDAFNKKLEEFLPDIILVSATYLSFSLAVNLITQSNAKNNTVIYGGIHCTTAPEDAINHKSVKYIYVGEGEIGLPLILNKLEDGEPIDGCSNLWVKKDDGEIVRNKMENIVENLDSLPFYDWDNFIDFHYLRIYQGKVYRMGDYSNSRGCVNKCTYCFYKGFYDAYGMEKNIIRRYSAERAIEELVYLKEKYGITFFRFHDSDFLNMGVPYLEEYSTLYRKYVNLPNTINACPEHILGKKAKCLVKMNTLSVSVGLESGNEYIRKQVLNRHCTNKVYINNSHILKKNGLRVSAPCLIGLPGESRENILETIQVCKKARVNHADFGIFFPFPRLALTNYAIEKGYLKKDQKIDHIMFGIESALKLDISHKDLRNLLRCSMLYLKLPRFMWPFIGFAEKYNTDNGITWKVLRKIYFFQLHFLDLSPFVRKIRRFVMVRQLKY
jgi:anaerobic magnesium-protoporphyrin IX monomethyl ester cyclase